MKVNSVIQTFILMLIFITLSGNDGVGAVVVMIISAVGITFLIVEEVI